MSRQSWDSYFFQVAELVASRSRDRSVKVGAVIVDPKYNSIVSTGYNDFPRGVNDSAEWRRDRNYKYMWTEHAERNAIYQAAALGHSLAGKCIYINQGGYPCADCARAIIQSGITAIHMHDAAWKGSNTLKESFEEARIMLSEAKVGVIHHELEVERDDLDGLVRCC